MNTTTTTGTRHAASLMPVFGEAAKCAAPPQKSINGNIARLDGERRTWRDATGSDASLEGILLSLFDAPGEPGHWRHVLESLARALGSTGLALLFASDSDEPGASDIVAGIPAAVIAALGNDVAQGPIEHALRFEDAGDPPAASAGRLLCARIDRGEGPVCRLVLYRAPELPPLDTQTITAFSSILPHAARALVIARRIYTLEYEAAGDADTSGLLSFGRISVDGDGCLLEANRVGRGMLAAAEALRLQCDRVVAANPLDNAMLQRCLRDLFASASSCEPSFLRVRCRDGDGYYAMQLDAPAASGAAFGAHARRVRMIVVDTRQAAAVSREALLGVYGLTRAECEVARCLAEGDCLKETAVRLGIAVTTVRTHLQRIFAKTRTRRQTELVRLLVTTGGLRLGLPE